MTAAMTSDGARHPLDDPTVGNPPSCASGHDIRPIRRVVDGVSVGMRWRCPSCGLDLGPAVRSAGITSGDQLAAATRIQDALPEFDLTIGQSLAVLTVALEALGALGGGDRR